MRLTGQVRKYISAGYAVPRKKLHPGHIKPREIDAKAFKTSSNGYAIQLPRKVPIPTPAVQKRQDLRPRPRPAKQIIQGRRESWKLENEPFLAKPPRNTISTVQGKLGVGAKEQWGAQLHAPGGRGQTNPLPDHPAELSHELGIRNRFGRGRDVGAAHRVVGQRLFEKAIHVPFVDPAHPLATVPDRAP